MDTLFKELRMRPKVSVIVPIYNVGECLKYCLESCISQTLKDIEIICINDGSTDNSLDILNEYAASDSRIKVLTQKNQGAGPARNNGIKISTGEFLAFIDPDDLYPNNNILQRLYDSAKVQNAKVCGGSLSVLDNGEIKSGSPDSIFKEEGWINFSDYQYDYFYQRYIYDSEFIKSNNLYFPDFRRFQDPPFFLSVMKLVKRFYAIPDITYQYYESRNGKTTDSKKVFDWLKGLEYCLNLSKIEGWNKVHTNICKRINSRYYREIFSYQYEHYNLPVIIQLVKTVNLMDLDIIRSLEPEFYYNDFIKSFLKKVIIRRFFTIEKQNGEKYLYIFHIKIRLTNKEK